MRLLFVQYAGDFREACLRFETGGQETYAAQRYSVDAVIDLCAHAEEVGVICCQTDSPYEERLNNGVTAIGVGYGTHVSETAVLEQVQRFRPTHLVMRTPMRQIFSWANRASVPTFATFADYFPNNGIKKKIKNVLLRRLLNHPNCNWVLNHGINSSKSLVEIGVDKKKVVPWDWPAGNRTPEHWGPKELDDNKSEFNLFYVGMMIDDKGVSDILDAVRLLALKDFPVKLTLAGTGDLARYRQIATGYGIADRVQFLGTVPNQSIIGLMASHDFVLVPSRHEYPEGIPLTIFEALCSHTPIIASDHPMFRDFLVDGRSAYIFAAKNPANLAEVIIKACNNKQLYQELSSSSPVVWQRLQLPVKWGEAVHRWAIDGSASDEWFLKYSLANWPSKQ